MRRTLLSSLSLLLLLVSSSRCHAQSASEPYLPLSRSEMSRRFPVRYLGTSSGGRPGYVAEKGERALPERIEVGPSGAKFESSDEENPAVAGNDREGKPWRVRLGNFTYRAHFYSADLDADGVQDLFIIFPTGGNGLAPSSHVFTLTFDARGRPVPFEADGYFEEDARGLFDLVDLDGDRRAELVYMNFDDGYWITNLYEAEGGRWRRVAGLHAQRSYPLYTRFTKRANRTPTTPARGRKPFAPDLSNVAPVLRGTLDSYEWANIELSEDVKLNVSSGGSKVVCSPVSWFGSFGLVNDAPEGREVVSAYGNEERVKTLLEQAVRNRTAVSLYGRRSVEGCSPEWFWLGD